MIMSSLLAAHLMAPTATAALTGCAGPGNDYTISSESDLRVLATDAQCRAPGLTFTLDRHITLNITPESPWTPIGSFVSAFQGTFNGNGNTISGLSIPAATDSSGLFGYISDAVVKNLTLTSVSIGGTGNSVGALVGQARSSTIQDSSVSGVVQGGSRVGGAIGYSLESAIIRVTASSSVSGSDDVGGLIGLFQADQGSTSVLTDSRATGNVTATTSPGGSFGGLVGELKAEPDINPATIEVARVSASGHVSAPGRDEVGGLIGRLRLSNFGDLTFTLSDSQADGDVTGASRVGGLFGYAVMSGDDDIRIWDAHATGDVTGTSEVGGFVGYLEKGVVLTESSAAGDVSGTGGSIGGFSGSLDDTSVTDVAATGTVQGGQNVGGIVGSLNASTLTDSISQGAVQGEQYVGGAIGSSTNSTIERSTAQGNTTCLSGSYVGGFIGWASTDTDIRDARATGSLSTTGTCERMGGFAGQVDGNASLEDTYATGAVAGTRLVGGLIGYLVNAEVSNSYATGAVSGTDRVGGLIGIAKSDAVIAQTRATGSVSGTEFVGGLAGVLGNYEDTVTPGSNVRLRESFATGDVTSSGSYAGGITGALVQDSFISDSYALGTVTGGSYVGSVLGKYIGAEGDVITRNTYGLGLLTAASAPAHIGGVVGGLDLPPGTTFAGNYWDPASTGFAFGFGDATSGFDASGTTPLTAAQMRSSTSFTGWNFTSVWGYQCGVSMTPQLRWYNPLAKATSAGPCPSPAPPAPSPSDGSSPSTSEREPQTVIANQPVTQAPGTAGFVIDGQVIPVRSGSGPRGTGLTLQAGPVEFNLRSQTANGRRVPLAPDGSLILARTGEVPISGDGLAPNSSVAVTLFSNPISLGSTPVGADGTFKTAPVIPASVPLGAHTLQLTGRTKTGDPFVLSIGVLVETPAAALGADPVISVRPAIITPGTSVAVTARGVQAGCRVTFTIAGKRAIAKASKKGVAQAQITMPNRLPRMAVVRGTVSGPRCKSVSVTTTFRTLT